MYCVLAVESEAANLIKDELQKLKPDWVFDICDDASHLELFSRKNPDVVVLSRFLPGEKPAQLLKHIQVLFPGSHIVLVVGELDEQGQGYIRMAKRYELKNYVTGVLPGDMPYTLPVALTHSRESEEEYESIPEGVLRQNDGHKDLEWEYGDINGDSQLTTPVENNHPADIDSEARSDTLLVDYRQEDDQPPEVRDIPVKPPPETRIKTRKPVKRRRQNGVLTLTTSNKGGAGKTTAAVTLAVTLSRSGIPVVLADFDFGAPDVATFFDIKDIPGIESLAGRSKNPYFLEELLVKAKKEENLYILPGVMDASMPYFRYGEVVEIVDLLMDSFPVVVGDTPPEFWTKDWMPELLERADIVFSIVDQSKFSIEDTEEYAPKLIEHDVDLENIKIVLNKFSPKLHNARTVEKHFCSGFKGRVSPKEMPRVVATIPEDWDMYNKYVYKGEVAGLDDEYSQWYRLAEEVANRTGMPITKPDKASGKKKGRNKKGSFSLGTFKKWFKK